MTQFTVNQMTLEDLKIALNWAKAEGWNPGIHDAENYYIADPQGFLMGSLDGIPISCISVVRYPDNFNFIGIYIVRPEYRGQGFGLKTWQEAFKLIPDQPAALDAVLEQVKTYEKSGFKPTHSHLRYQGMIKGKIDPNVIDLKTINFQQLCAYDRQYFPSDRPQFLQRWIHQPDSQAYGILDQGKLLGYGVIRKACSGFKLAPLFAEDPDIAEKLLLSLSSYAQEAPIFLDVPNINPQGIALVQRYKMTPMFECVRMNTSTEPILDWTHIFGVTTLEIG